MTIEQFIERLIEERADGLCMDVPAERRRLARLVGRGVRAWQDLDLRISR